MSRVVREISMSLDGFVTGPNVHAGNGMGDGGERLHDWRFDAKTETDAAALGPIIRAHWAIENSRHWIMDMTFRDDECRLRTDHAPANFTTIRHMAHNLIRKAPGKDSFRLRRKVAAWDDDFLASLLTA